MKEEQYDALLAIMTEGNQQGFHESFHYHRYEPTPYKGLKQLFDSLDLNKNDTIVDFGCGKGRLSFFAHHFYHIKAVGVEMDDGFYKCAELNKEHYFHAHNGKKQAIQFVHCLAEDYEIRLEDTVFYFFNPFSVQIFMRVVDRILQSVEQHYRDITLILYYGSDDYVYFMENHSLFVLKEEIPIQGLYEHNDYERFLVYKLMY
ncbi:class I SAM-dependent methyltransferase [Bacillus testis]|uniref:class I SAM-dependent methyltransferase n=1 Tax=Bacillus testis TaxID=1622072 RepID=UPI00067F6EAF|nr:class I SAM-dependent methyltransferase [Bacillus testis]